MNRRHRLLPPLAAGLALAALAGCGGGEDPDPPSEPPAELLSAAVANPVESGESSIYFDLELEGSSILAGNAFAKLDGPFRAASDGGLPSFDLALDGEAAGFGVDGQLVSTGEDAFVVFFGENYRVGSENVSEVESRLPAGGTLGLRFDQWFTDPRYADSEQVGGTETQRIEAGLDSGAVAEQLGTLAREAGAPALLTALAEGAGPGVAEAWVAFDDQTIRRIRVQFPFTVSPELAGTTAGIESGAVSLDVAVSDVGADVEIEQPAGGGFNPIEQLISRIRTLAGLAL